MTETPPLPGRTAPNRRLNRRAILAATGMAAAAALAGCADDGPPETTPTETPDGTHEEDVETPPEPPDEPLPEGEPSASNARLRELVAGNAGFATSLHDRFVADGDADNVFFSPYSVSMVLVVPDEGRFEETEAKLSGATLFGVFEALGDAGGDLRMPSFEYEFDAALSEALRELRMGAAFGPGADFSTMVEEGNGPGIDEVFHEAFVSVDEEGTEAAAATAVTMVESAPPESFDLTIDRPFLFCIRDRPTDAVLFLGRVADAGAAQG